MIYSTLSANEIRDCLDYERRLQAAQLGVGAPPTDPPPKWNKFQSEQTALNSRNQTNYPPYQRQHPLITNNVSMPADTLEAIIRAIGNVSRPTPPTAPRIVTKYVPHPRPTPTPVVHRGRGGGGGGRGQGSNNRRGRCSNNATRDPRRNHVNNNNHASSSSTPNTSITGPINTDTIINSNITSIDTNEMAFFNEFANADMGPGGGNDVVMNSDNTTEENFVV